MFRDVDLRNRVRGLKRWKLPFWLSNTIRGALLIVMLLLLFGIVGGRKGFVVHHALNPFNPSGLDFDDWLLTAVIVVSLALPLFVYRPFCYLMCPFEFFSWLAERLSLARVRIDPAKCTKCGAWIRAYPSDAAKGKVDGRLFIADCTSCARCLNVCPDDLIRYGFAFAPSARAEEPGRENPVLPAASRLPIMPASESAPRTQATLESSRAPGNAGKRP